ncbi:glutamate synthase small subunit [Ligilactobacillus salitolerans]|uniref:Glutamate synthase small subunit n=1 Tax=Ligilactobacillus salitolerans TaxID=1808352 RepID=A0A401ITD1_9LACO|nr:glutamate synthase subunit beta [Ligilactobacillus salitolerans]GBG94778.1 glutamate synthase small subunit [Ligilactobacillus salitolerans]
MSDPRGFMKYERKDNPFRPIGERIKDFNELEDELDEKERRKQAARCMNCGVAHCHHGIFFDGRLVGGCPNDNLIPEWNDLVSLEQDRMAFDRLTKTNPLAEFTGLVCPAPCELSCNEALNGQGITIRNNEHFIIEKGFANGWVKDQGKPVQKNGLKVAVIGSGPAGLAAAWRLTQLGYSVSVYEKADRPGGLLMYGIPNMKLPKEMVARRVKIMEELGVLFHLQTEVGVDVTLEELKSEYLRVLVCIGAEKPRDLPVNGRNLGGIEFAVDFLAQVTRDLLAGKQNLQQTLKGKNVLVVGGGDTGNDCIGTAVRLGAASIYQVDNHPEPLLKRKPDNPWPEYPRVKKVGYGQAEAQEVFNQRITEYERTVIGFTGSNGQVKHAQLAVVKNHEPEQRVKKTLPVDLVLLAMGFAGPRDDMLDNFEIQATDPHSRHDYSTNDEQVFIAGDARRGSSLVIWAFNEGKLAAQALAESLKTGTAVL